MKLCNHCGHLSRSRVTCDHCGVMGGAGEGAKVAAIAAMLGLALTGCLSGDDDDKDGEDTMLVQAEYGVADTGYIDADGDGVRAVQDCDDNNADSYPGAPETPGDGVDSNCDGDDDT